MTNEFTATALSTSTSSTSTSLDSLAVSPAQVIRGTQILAEAIDAIARLGCRGLLISGKNTLVNLADLLHPILTSEKLQISQGLYTPDCSESTLKDLRQQAQEHQADVIIGIGGGKALDTAKLVAHQLHLPVVTIPTSAATCAAWTALSNVYTNAGAFLYDVALAKCPDLLILDYELVKTAPQHTLVAGIGDAIAKWYEASVSSGTSTQTMIIAAVQQARVLRDILFQKSATAIAQPGGEEWREVVDANVLLAGVIGGIGGAQCRTVAAHAVHNGLTHISGHQNIHGEKVAYGILVQLRLEEMIQNNQLAATSRQQLWKFYTDIGLPCTLDDLGLGEISLKSLQKAAEIALEPKSDIHRLPFKVTLEQLMAAMVSTTAPTDTRESINRVAALGMTNEVEG